MVDPGEDVRDTLKREFSEEALGGRDAAEMKPIWKHGVVLYKGYVDDPRNTDNAWVETIVVNFHDDDGRIESVQLTVGQVESKSKTIDGRVTPRKLVTPLERGEVRRDALEHLHSLYRLAMTQQLFAG